MRRLFLVVLAFSSFSVAQHVGNDAVAADVAVKTIRPEVISAHMRFLSDSLLQGRAPGTQGYDIAAAYVATQMESMGLKPAGVSGTWFQQVPLRKYNVIPEKTSLELLRDNKIETLAFGKDYLSGGDPVATDTVLDAPLVFVGYGITAPEMNYDDYAGIDVKGKAIVMLDGAPESFPSVQRAYYSSYDNKTRDAVAHGAIGAFAILTPEAEKRMPWAIYQWIFTTPMLSWLHQDGTPHNSFPQMRGGAFLSQRAAELLFAGAPKSLEQVFADARGGQLDHFALPVRAKMRVVSHHGTVQSPNVVGILPGSDPELRNEYVVFTAHLDHLGVCPPVDGDNVCHGAFDNASGTAAVLEIARAFASLPQRPRRSILFVFVTGEEKGLLGSDYFANNPTVAPGPMVANINIDGLPGLMYPLKKLAALGGEHSTLGKDAEDAARRMGFEVTPDPMPERVLFIRSDQYSFVRRSVPAIFFFQFKSLDPNLNGEEKKQFVTKYHTPADNIDQPLDFESGAKGAQLNFLLGYKVAQQTQRPTWNADSFLGLKFGAAEK